MADAIDRLDITELLNRHQIYIYLADADAYAGLYAANGVYESPFASATGRNEIATMFRSLGASGFTAKTPLVGAGAGRTSSLPAQTLSRLSSTRRSRTARLARERLRRRSG